MSERADLFPSTIEEEIATVEREIKLRRRVYPRRVANGQMTQAFANAQIAAMTAVLRRLEGLRGMVERPNLPAARPAAGA
jgi:hypothetical protein